MKKIVCILAFIALTISSANEISAQRFRPLDKSPMDIASFPSSWKESNKIVRVVYSRPQLKGRPMSKLAPNDKVWRTGANEAAEITFYRDVKFGGKKVKAGTYSLFTIPGDKEWTIILNNASNVWGAYTYKEEDDVLRVKAKVSSSIAPIEAFSMTFDKDMELYLGWGYTIVSVPIK